MAGTHFKSLFDASEFLFAHDLGGKEVVVQIERCTGGVIQGDKGRKAKKPMVTFVGKKKRLALNKTNSKAIAKMYGPIVEDWSGKWVTLYPTTTEFGGEVVECIRVKPTPPNASKQVAAPDPEPTAEEGPDAGGR